MIDGRPWPPSLFEVLAAVAWVALVVVALLLLAWAVMGPISWR
jgi:hypothetical protein